MKITSVNKIYGRGTVVVVALEGVPWYGIKIGILIHQGDRAWKVSNIEQSTPCPPGESIGLWIEPLFPLGHDISPSLGDVGL